MIPGISGASAHARVSRNADQKRSQLATNKHIQHVRRAFNCSKTSLPGMVELSLRTLLGACELLDNAFYIFNYNRPSHKLWPGPTPSMNERLSGTNFITLCSTGSGRVTKVCTALVRNVTTGSIY